MALPSWISTGRQPPFLTAKTAHLRILSTRRRSQQTGLSLRDESWVPVPEALLDTWILFDGERVAVLDYARPKALTHRQSGDVSERRSLVAYRRLRPWQA